MKVNKLLLGAVAMCCTLFTVAQTKYKNPVYGSDFPDPTVVRAKNGTFYTYATGCKMLSSTNFVKWTKQSDPISRPTWNDSTYTENGSKKTDYYSLWACDVSYLDGKYYMQYASALWGNGYRTGIGVAVGDSPTKFTDAGKLFRSTEIGVWNSIDPCFYQEKDKKYIIWGSFHDICIAELEDDGLAVKNFKPINNPNDAGKQKRFSGATKIAGGAFEGPMIHKRGKYYYLFCSVGSCCEGANSTYKTVVGRSTSLKGPYVNKTGGDMKYDNYQTIIRGNDRWRGPGHNSEVVTDDEGQDWLLYHCYDMNNGCNGRLLLLDKINWVNDWPEIEGGVPSSEEKDGPVFYTGDGANMTYKLDNADFSMSNFKYWNATCTGDASMISSAGSNVFMPFARVTSANGDCTFDINQQLTGMKNGIYELRVQSFSRGENADIYVNNAKTPVVNEMAPPSADATTANRFLDGKYEQSAYGIVTNNKLTIGASSAGLIAGDRFALANVRIIYREKNEEAAKILTETFAENFKRLEKEPRKFYKTYLAYLEGYLATAQGRGTETDRYNALTKIQLTLDSLQNSYAVYDSLTREIAIMDSYVTRAISEGSITESARATLEEAMNVANKCNYTDKEVLALITRMRTETRNIFYVYHQGDGTEASPYVITTAEQLDHMHDVLIKDSMVYFQLGSDIDMKDIPWKQLNSNSSTYRYWINFDGKGHIIFNLHNTEAEKYYPSFFGILCGECRNVGFVDATIDASNATGAAIIAGGLGYSTFKKEEELLPVIVENCYVTGSVDGKGYLGAIGGNLASSPVFVRNVYSAANVMGADEKSNVSGGLLGRIRTSLLLERSYAAGKVVGYEAGGIIGGGQQSTTKGGYYNNIFAWNDEVNGTSALPIGNLRDTDAKFETLFCDEMLINGYGVEDGTKDYTMIRKAGQWGTPWYSNPTEGNGWPILQWQYDRGDHHDYCGFSQETIIRNLDANAAEKTSNSIYDLSGRRLSAVLQHGIYIINGKKIVR